MLQKRARSRAGFFKKTAGKYKRTTSLIDDARACSDSFGALDTTSLLRSEADLRSSFDVLYERVAAHGLPFQHSENHHLPGTRKEVTLDRFFHVGRLLLLVFVDSLDGRSRVAPRRDSTGPNCASTISTRGRNHGILLGTEGRASW